MWKVYKCICFHSPLVVEAKSSPTRAPGMHSPWAQSHQSVSVPTQHWALQWICLITNSTCCNLGRFSSCAVYGLFLCCWLKWNVSSLLFKELNSLSPVQITWVSQWRLKAAPHAHRTSSKWVKPLLEANLRHKAKSHRWTRWIPSFLHLATSRGWAAVLRINTWHYLHFEVFPQTNLLSKLHLAMQKY